MADPLGRGTRKRTAEERIRDRAYIADQRLRGVSLLQINAQLSAMRPYDVSYQQTRDDYAAVQRAWKEQAIEDVGAHIAQQLAAADHVMAEGWRMHLLWQQEREKRSTTLHDPAHVEEPEPENGEMEPHPDGPKLGHMTKLVSFRRSTIVTEQMLGNPVWLRYVTWGLEYKARLLGLFDYAKDERNRATEADYTIAADSPMVTDVEFTKMSEILALVTGATVPEPPTPEPPAQSVPVAVSVNGRDGFGA